MDPKVGLTADQITPLRGKFGPNAFPPTAFASFLTLVIGTFEDPVLIILFVAAAVSIGIGLYEDPEKGWIEGTAIFVACFAVSFITAGNDYSKQLQFLELEKASANDERCSVLRDGIIERINPCDIVVGDVMVMQAGDMIPADGIVIDDNEIAVNESTLTGEPDDLKKSKTKDCFIYSSCLVTVAEECRAVAVGVGYQSQWGMIKKNLITEPVDTPLQEKLNDMTTIIGYMGGGAAALTFVSLFIRAFVAPVDGEEPYQAIIHAAIIAVTVVVVAVPEGLPLAVTIALAYSTKKMYEDNNLIRTLAACETMGNATNICSDKTGTLTENRMTVVEGQFCDTKYNKDEFGAMNGDNAPASVKELVGSHSCVNRMAYLVYKDHEGNQLHRPNIIGNKTEGALLLMAKGWGFNDDQTRKDMFDEKRDASFSFNSQKKRSTTVVVLPSGKVRVFCKGAPDWLLNFCSGFTDKNGMTQKMTAAKRKDVDDHINEMASRALRTLCLTHRDYASVAALPKDWRENAPDDKDLVMDCIVGIIDPLRDDVKEAVATAQRAGVTVRMVTGDNINTARAIAKQCGILTEGGEAVEGPTFRNMTPVEVDKLLPRLQVMGRSSPDDKYLMVTRLNGYGLPTDEESWIKMHGDKPGKTFAKDSETLMPGMRAAWEENRPDGGEVVGVTGDGTNDAPALKAADVGLSMGITGTKVAQGASDIVILDDKFSSIVCAIMWGRSVFDNIRKFLQFQLTVNVVACAVVFIAAVSGGAPPLTAVQMLWVNLIMDTMGALALATEPPNMELLDRLPYKRTASLISLPMWRNIFVQSTFQLILICVLVFDGARLFGVHENDWCKKWESDGSTGKSWSITYSGSPASITCASFDTECPDGDGECWEDYNDNISGDFDRIEYELDCLTCKEHDYTHGTIMFNAFIFCQFFNEYNARSLTDDLDVWSGALKNPIFMGVSAVTFGLQIMLVEVGGEWLRTAPLNMNQWLITIGLGALTIPFGLLMRFIPVAEDPESFAGVKPIKVKE